MVMERNDPQDWQSQLISMGYHPTDVSRARNAGVTNVACAVDWLLNNPTTPAPPRQPSHSNPDPRSSTTSHSNQNHHHQVNETGRSIDNLALARQPIASPTTTAPPTRTSQPDPLAQDDELRRVLELSRREQDQRDVEKVLILSKQEDAARQDANQNADVIRAIQESLQNTSNTVPNQQDSWPSLPFSNPVEALRTHIHHPVGLRNIGNTCYLNSLLQVYYHLPDFRRAIMSFRAPPMYPQPFRPPTADTDVSVQPETPPSQTVPVPDQMFISEPSPEQPSQDAQPSDNSDNRTDKLTEQTVQRNAVEFVIELQRLFSAMALGNHNCPDPTPVTRAMRDAHGNPILIGAQRDASEFNQLFLDIVEKGLGVSHPHETPNQVPYHLPHDLDHIRSSDIESEQDPTKTQSDNIVKNMFTMKFRQEIWRCSEHDRQTLSEVEHPITTNWETTSIIVDATTRQERNLHGGLQDFVRTQIKYLDGNRDRDQQSSTNSDTKQEPTSSHPHEESADLSEGAQHTALKTVWFTRLPIVVVVYLQRGSYNRETLRAEKVHDRYDFPLKLAFDRYLEINREAAEVARKEVEGIRKERNYVLGLLDRYKRFPVDDDATFLERRGENKREDFFEAGVRIQKRLREAMQSDSTFHSVPNVTRESIKSSLDTIEKVLDHDRKRCNELEARLNAIKPESDAYRELENVGYDLHAVLVHDGAPESGHYWTFVNNMRAQNENEKWMKLSDSNVSLVSEEEMLSSSLGGNGKASAYCLMYRTAGDSNALESIAEESKVLLPQHLTQEIEEASKAFLKEVEAAKTAAP